MMGILYRSVGALALLWTLAGLAFSESPDALSSTVAETPSFGISTAPQISFPVGGKSENYHIGLAGRLDFMATFPSVPLLTPSIDLGYSYVPVDLSGSGYASGTNLSLIRAGFGLRAALAPSRRLSIYGRTHASLFVGVLHGGSVDQGVGFSWGVGIGGGLLLSRHLMLTAETSFESYTGLYDAISVTLGLTTRISGSGSAAIPRSDYIRIRKGSVPNGYIDFLDAELDRIFPVLFKYYGTSPIGTVTVVNTGRTEVQDIKVSLSTVQYMDASVISERIDRLLPGERQEVDLYALFNKDILGITEGTVLAAEVRADYKVGGYAGEDTGTLTLETYDRNALRWDDDRKIAAFVTARDEEIKRYTRNLAAIVREDGTEFFDSNLQLAIAIFSALQAHGCTYVVDPSSSYGELSRDVQAIDSVQFPRQTLQYRAGDCDDLSATYAAMLESVGIPSAFITVPGHIYTAFGLDMSETEARHSFSSLENFIVDDERTVWIPVEATALHRGFLEAWDMGARQWREHNESNRAELIPTWKAWSVYEPVAFSIATSELDFPHKSDITEEYREQLSVLTDREIAAQARPLEETLSRNPTDVRTRNKLGAVYARYGRLNQARTHFQRSALAGYVPAEINLGNLAFLERDYTAATGHYNSAFERFPENPAVLLGLARVAHAQERYDDARTYHQELAQVSPSLAERYAYLTSEVQTTSRASEYSGSHPILWWEEP